jgi:hypothetical protein
LASIAFRKSRQKVWKAIAEVRARVDVDHAAALERLLDRLAHLVVLEDLGHLAQLGDEDEAADLREALLEAVDELQHEARDVGHRRRDVAQDHQLRAVLAPLLEDQLEGHPAVGHVAAQDLWRSSLPFLSRRLRIDITFLMRWASRFTTSRMRAISSSVRL